MFNSINIELNFRPMEKATYIISKLKEDSTFSLQNKANPIEESNFRLQNIAKPLEDSTFSLQNKAKPIEE